MMRAAQRPPFILMASRPACGFGAEDACIFRPIRDFETGLRQGLKGVRENCVLGEVVEWN